MTRATRPSRGGSQTVVEDKFPEDLENILKLMRPTEQEESFDFDKDMAIDLFNLHVEWADHGRRALRYIKESRRANMASSLAEERVKTIRSQLVKEAKNLGISAADLREAHYRLHPRYIQAKREAIEAEHYAALLANIVIEMRGRKQALENEVGLQGREYYVDPQVPKNISHEEVERLKGIKEQGVESKIRERMRR